MDALFNRLQHHAELSAVHVSRTVSLLRRMGLLRTTGGVLAVEDQESLISVAGFDARYLHLDARPLRIMQERAERTADTNRLPPCDEMQNRALWGRARGHAVWGGNAPEQLAEARG